MNFLAHIHLSGNNDDIKLGNFIADSVRTKDLPNFKKDIQLGIQLHWAIDDFTDHHETVKKSKALLYEEHHKYGAVLVDIFYDHYLARDWKKYSTEELSAYVEHFYQLLIQRQSELPERINHMRPYMIKYNWLYNYQFIEGIERVLGGMSRRASFKNRMHLGTQALQEHYKMFEEHFNTFYPDLEAYVIEKKAELRATL